MGTHRHIQIASLMDKATDNRVRYYINAQRASRIGNQGAAAHFTRMAQRWEHVRQTCAHRIRPM
jgi:hypothetical protein